MVRSDTIAIANTQNKVDDFLDLALSDFVCWGYDGYNGDSYMLQLIYIRFKESVGTTFEVFL